jgi:hypothetical protein
MIRSALFAALLFAAPVAAQDAPVRFHDVLLEPEMGTNGLRRPAYFVTFVVENVSVDPLAYIDVVVVGRDSEGTIVETERAALIAEQNLPNGLQPGERFAVRQTIPAYNPSRTVTSAEIQIGQVRFAD